MKRGLIVLLALCLLPVSAVSTTDAYLSGEDLKALEPAYEAFLSELADLLIQKGLLLETEREDWVLYQLGDYLQNGGFGTIAVMYTPGLLGVADEAVTVRRFSVETGAGTLNLETLRRYAPAYSQLPGLPLDVELVAASGEAVRCRFRWIADDGAFQIWDGTQGALINVGATYINDSKPLYWYADPYDGLETTLTLEILYAEEDRTMAEVMLTLLSGPDFWAPEVLR